MRLTVRRISRESVWFEEDSLFSAHRDAAVGAVRHEHRHDGPDAAKAVIGQFPASVMTLALLAGYPDTRKRRSDAAENRLSAIL